MGSSGETRSQVYRGGARQHSGLVFHRDYRGGIVEALFASDQLFASDHVPQGPP
jgi:hypothetical protein